MQRRIRVKNLQQKFRSDFRLQRYTGADIISQAFRTLKDNQSTVLPG